MEMLVAITVIGVGLFAAANIVYSNLNLVDRNTDEVISINMAREGVELAKQLRDSNWLAGNPFDQGTSSTVDYTGTPVWDGISAPSFNFTANTLSDANASVVKLASGMYANAVGAILTGTPTGYARLVTFHPICNDQSVLNSGSTCESVGKLKIGIRVESQVKWTRKTITKTIAIFEDLYDWK